MQSGNPLYRPELYKQPPQGKSRPIWVRFFAKNTFRICARATKFFLAPFHNFLAPNWGVFFQGGSLCEVCGQNVRNVGRRAVITANSHNHSMLIYMPLWNMWAECEKCGQQSFSLYVQWVLVIYYHYITTALLPTFPTFCPHISQSDPPWKETAHFGAEKLWNGANKIFVAPAHIINVFFAKNRTQIGPLLPRGGCL